MEPNLLPQARHDGLLEEKIQDETLLYDTERHRAIRLNPSALLLWKLCDGQTSASQAAQRLSQELGLPEDEELVWHGLAELKKENLLLGSLPAGAGSVSRRDLVKRLGMTLAVGIPLVSAMVAPLPAAAQSTGASSLPPL